MRPSHIFAGFGCLFLGYSHGVSPFSSDTRNVSPLYVTVILKSFSALNASRTGSLLHEQLEVFKSMPHS
jgi:hypothetical protein